MRRSKTPSGQLLIFVLPTRGPVLGVGYTRTGDCVHGPIAPPRSFEGNSSRLPKSQGVNLIAFLLAPFKIHRPDGTTPGERDRCILGWHFGGPSSRNVPNIVPYDFEAFQ